LESKPSDLEIGVQTFRFGDWSPNLQIWKLESKPSDLDYLQPRPQRFIYKGDQKKFMIQPQQSIGIFTTDLNLTIRSWDSWMTGVTGISAESVRGAKLMELFPDMETRGLLSSFKHVLNSGKVETLSQHEHPYLISCVPQTFSKRFSQMQQRVTLAPLRDREHIIGTIVTIEDITPQFDREQDLTDFAANIESANVAKNDQVPVNNKEIIQALGDDNWQVRQTAVETLVGHGGPDAIALLVRKVQDEHQELSVLNSALQAIAKIEGDIITPLAELLKVPNADLRGYAVLALGEQPDRRAIPLLIQALNDENTNVRYNAIEALGKLKAAEAIEALADVADSRDFFLAFPALDALKQIGDPSVTPRIVTLLEDELLRDPAIELLGQIGDETAVQPLAALLVHSEAPTVLIAQAITAIYKRYEELYNEGRRIAEIANSTINAPMQNLLSVLNSTQGDELGALAQMLGWLLDNTRIEYALTQLLGKPTAQKEVLKTLIHHGTRLGEFLIEQLDAEDIETRQAAISALGRIGDKRAVPALTRILSEDDEELLISVAQALTTIGDASAYKALLNRLGHPNPAVRQSVIAALNAINHPDMAQRTIALLKDVNPLVRESAAKIVGYIGFPHGFEALLTCCHDTDEAVRQAAIESIPYFEDERIIPTLTETLQKDSPRIRAAAARAFGAIDDASVIVILQRALNDSEPWTRYFAARSLGEQDATQSWQALAKMAQTDTAHQVRFAAIESLGQIGAVQAIPILAPLIESKDTDLANAAISALGQINHVEALAPLLMALQSSQPDRKLEAIYALKNHHEAESVTALQQIAATDEDVQIVQEIINLLAQQATSQAINALLALTSNPSRREACVIALSQLNESQIDKLANGLQHEYPGVRTATIDALTRMKNPLVTQHLITALSDKEASVRLAAITAIGHLGTEQAVHKLSQIASEDPNLAVRRSAQKILQ